MTNRKFTYEITVEGDADEAPLGSSSSEELTLQPLAELLADKIERFWQVLLEGRKVSIKRVC